MTYHVKTVDAARGHWSGILQKLGVAQSFLTGRHGPCPFCGGKDRWRWVDEGGNGGGICNQCGGVGNGIDLVMKLRDCDFKEASREVDAVLGNHRFEPDAPRKSISPEDRAAKLREVWKQSSPTVEGDLVHRYLEARGVDQRQYWGLRTSEGIWSPEGTFPAMIGVVSDHTGKPVSLHRTFLDGKGGKAPIERARMLMPGELVDGCCIRLSELGDNDEVLGVAEGIETALAASAIFEIPVWAVLNTSMMTKWIPPEGIREVVIFGDNDANHAGHRAAYALSNILRTHQRYTGLATSVQIPPVEGMDWNDDLLARRKSETPA